MQCHDNPDCAAEADVRIWCPTWSNAFDGPTNWCVEHAQRFHNHQPGGQFFWGKDADDAFASVESFIQRGDDRYFSARLMVRRGQHVAGYDDCGPLTYGVFVVDGKAWLLTYFHVARLGWFSAARQRFPMLFSMPKKVRCQNA